MALIGIAENRQTPPAEAAAARNKAIDLFTPLAADHPELPEGLRFLSMSLKRRAATQMAQPNQLASATADLSRAASLDEQRVAAHPDDAVAKLDLALGQGYLSGVLRRSGDLDGAIAALTRAMDVRHAILAADPQNLRVRTQLLGDCGKLASMASERHDQAAARAAIDEGTRLAAVVTGAAAQNPDFQAALAEFQKLTGHNPRG
jgi:tetratricopeptide (TPR) repeat protein